MDNVVKLLRAMATGTDYIARKHDVILNKAADDMEKYREALEEIQRAYTEGGNARYMASVARRVWEVK